MISTYESSDQDRQQLQAGQKKDIYYYLWFAFLINL
jgi:hypothetical protein